jgi:hypothetical protein
MIQKGYNRPPIELQKLGAIRFQLSDFLTFGTGPGVDVCGKTQIDFWAKLGIWLTRGLSGVGVGFLETSCLATNSLMFNSSSVGTFDYVNRVWFLALLVRLHRTISRLLLQLRQSRA